MLLHRYSVFLLALGLLALPVGCRFLAGEAETVELTIWAAPTGVEEAGFRKLCKRYEREHPGVRVLIVGASTPEKLIRAIVAGAPPDISYMYGASAVGPMAANTALTPLDTYFQNAGFRESDFLPTSITQGRYRGKLYAMPVTRDSRALYWNGARFKEAGLDPDTPPRTLEEALDFAARLTQRRPDGGVEKLGMYLPDEPEIVFSLFGGGVWDAKTGHITANRAENIRALRWLISLADAQGGYKAIAALMPSFGNIQSAQNPLATGKIAMKIEGEWAAMHLDRYAPGTDYRLGLVPHPADRPDLANMAWQDGDVMVIPVGARHPEAAWEFIRWMQQPTQQEEYALVMNNLPSLLALRGSPRLASGSRSRRALGFVLNEIAGASRNSHYFPALPVTQLYRSALKNAFDRALYHDLTPEKALAEVQQLMTREMQRYSSER